MIKELWRYNDMSMEINMNVESRIFDSLPWIIAMDSYGT